MCQRSFMSATVSGGHIYMCVAEVARSAGYGSGRWNKHKATAFSIEQNLNLFIQICGQGISTTS